VTQGKVTAGSGAAGLVGPDETQASPDVSMTRHGYDKTWLEWRE